MSKLSRIQRVGLVFIFLTYLAGFCCGEVENEKDDNKHQDEFPDNDGYPSTINDDGTNHLSEASEEKVESAKPFDSGMKNQRSLNIDIVGDVFEEDDDVVGDFEEDDDTFEDGEDEFEETNTFDEETDEERNEEDDEDQAEMLEKQQQEEARLLRIEALLESADELRSDDGDIESAIALYQEAAKVENSSEAHNALGEIYLRGEFGAEINISLATEHFNKSADMGYAQAQHNLAFMFAAGIGTQVDTAMSVIYDYFASTGFSYEAQMSLGYRHLNGYGVPRSCQSAVQYYESAAQRAIETLDNAAMHGVDMVRLANDAQRNTPTKENEDVIQYIQQTADGGDQFAQLQMGRLQFYGARGVAENPAQAARYFQQAAAQGNVQAMGQLGHVYLQGRGVDQNNDTALEWFQQAADKGDAFAQNGLGFIYLHGWGTTKDLAKAMKYFKYAADQGNRDAQFHLAEMHYKGLGLDAPDYSKALNLFTQASRLGHTPALYYMAKMHLHGRGTMKSCHMAVNLFKTVAQRGPWADVMHDAFGAYSRGDYEQAIILYARLGEEGYELAQHNAGWLLDHYDDSTYHEFDSKEVAFRYFSLSADQGNSDAQRILGDYHYYNLVPERAVLAHSTEDAQNIKTDEDGGKADDKADDKPAESPTAETGKPAQQHPKAQHSRRPDPGVNADGATDEHQTSKNEGTNIKQNGETQNGESSSTVQTKSDRENFARAARHYQLASDAQNAQASFNLGYMHQFGIGLPQDLHLAKRMYDRSLEESADGYVPVVLALFGLKVHSFYLDSLMPYLKNSGWQQVLDDNDPWNGFVEWVTRYDTMENIVLVSAITLLVIILTIRLRRDQGFWH